ncbi:hypothetical protein [Cerasicoccus arenae]|uniref:Uncharacterized protein n=1 Tax=Cerasicoccus arenae TaxID=424488 RepID=A0A8J3DAR1_9BACT|nr:hypothetical protein [Cerasicoccus arenae]MBK1857938.1 hypothetical protein [Cerasicoccus arenae]GHB97945.1 hypothetical protein GCM10007047_12350 [Cerasicoccus arenae]
MKAKSPLWSWLLIALLSPSLHANDAANELDTIDLSKVPVVSSDQVTIQDLAAISKFESGEIVNADDGRYTPEQVNKFLDQFVGVWEGHYAISTMDGKELRTMDTRVTYSWETVGETQVLKNQSVYATGDQLSYSTSLSYYWLGRLVTEVEQENIKRIYLGRIAPTGDSVSWNVANAEEALRSSTRETFQSENGSSTIFIRGYEELRQGIRVVYLNLQGRLTRAAE